MIPNLSPPVLRPEFFKTDWQIVFIGVSRSGRKKFVRELVSGADPNPNTPQRFIYPVPCGNWCYLYSKPSRCFRR